MVQVNRAAVPAGFEELKAQVDANGGVQTFTMEQVREAYGAGRLGVHVRTGISKALHGMGLGHHPGTLPDSQYEKVRIYRLGSPVADIISAVLNPGDDHDQRLREMVSGDVSEVLAKIRELVCP